MPRVTQILPQKRRENRRNVYIDGKFAFGASDNVVARFRLVEGMELTAGEVEKILSGEIRQECLDKGLGYLQRRLHSRSELKRKLLRAEFGEEVVEGVLEDLVRLGYLDDARFAKTRAMSAAEHKHHGKRRAMQELMKAGVKTDVAKAALDDVYDSHDSLATARELAQKQAARLKRLEPIVARRRLAGMLQRRGFDYEAVKTVIDEVIGKEGG